MTCSQCRYIPFRTPSPNRIGRGAYTRAINKIYKFVTNTWNSELSLTQKIVSYFTWSSANQIKSSNNWGDFFFGVGNMDANFLLIAKLWTINELSRNYFFPKPCLLIKCLLVFKGFEIMNYFYHQKLPVIWGIEYMFFVFNLPLTLLYRVSRLLGLVYRDSLGFQVSCAVLYTLSFNTRLCDLCVMSQPPDQPPLNTLDLRG